MRDRFPLSRRTFLTAAAASAALPALGAADAGRPILLFAHFHGNGETGLHLASSRDGLTFQRVREDASFLKPVLGTKLMRDPCILRGPDGRFHMVWTTGWNDRGFGYSSSDDLLTWSKQLWVGVNEQVTGALNTWAPELFYDRASQHYYIFWATTIPGRFPQTDNIGDGKYNHRIYFTKTRDFASFTDAKLLFDPGFNCIDATIIDFAGRLLMVFKDERLKQKCLRMATADRIEGPWSSPSDPFTGDWVEGPSVVKTGQEWTVYYDHYTRPQHYGALRTRDFKTFNEITKQLRFPPNPRHGSFVWVSEAEFQKLSA